MRQQHYNDEVDCRINAYFIKVVLYKQAYVVNSGPESKNAKKNEQEINGCVSCSFALNSIGWLPP